MGATDAVFSLSSVVVVVLTVDIAGGGVVVVVCSVLMVRVSGAAQPANATEPEIKAAPIVRRKREFVSIIVWFLRVRAVAVWHDIHGRG
jgi:hypothetical protein